MNVSKVNGEKPINYEDKAKQEKAIAETTEIVNVDTLIEKLNDEVYAEFRTSKVEVYKEALRSILSQRIAYDKQIVEVKKDISILDKAQEELEIAFKKGILITTSDCRDIVNQVRGKRFFREDS